MSVKPTPDDGEPTVVMPARAVADPSLTEMVRRATASRRARGRRLAICAVGLAFVVGIGAGWLFFPRQQKRVAVSAPTTREVAPTPVTPPATSPPPAPSPRAPDKPVASDKPVSPRQMLNEIFEGRDRGLAVNASVAGGAVRVGASRPGYVYVLAASASQSDSGPLFVAVLFPPGGDTHTRTPAGEKLQQPNFEGPPETARPPSARDGRQERG